MSQANEFEAVAGELGHGGDARVESRVGAVFVAGLFPGERARLRLVHGKRPSARLISIVTPSPHRREPPCPIAERCGGCGLMALRPKEASRQKRAMVARAASVDEVIWYDSPRDLRYRRRARLHYDAGRARLGYLGRRSHSLVDVDSCLVLTEALDAALPAAREALASLEGKGELAASETADGVSLVFEADRAQPPEAFHALEALSRREGVVSVALRVPDSPVPSVFGAEHERHVGPDGLALRTPLGGFVQANREINDRLARLVADWAEPEGERVAELFSGSGNLTVLLAARAAWTLAVEGYPEAVTLAEENLAARGLTARLLAEDAERARLPKVDVLVLDPPRRGFAELGRALEEARPTRVVLVSCDLGSLSRELRTLRRAGYEVERVAGFDMFPQTPHLETVVRLRAR